MHASHSAARTHARCVLMLTTVRLRAQNGAAYENNCYRFTIRGHLGACKLSQ